MLNSISSRRARVPGGPGLDQRGLCTHIWGRASPGEPTEASLLPQHVNLSLSSQAELVSFCLTNHFPAL